MFRRAVPTGSRVILVLNTGDRVEHILQEASTVDPHILILFGGLHQIQKPDLEVARVATALHDDVKVERVAPGHCTGEPEFAALKKAFGDKYVYAGAGTVVDLP